MHYSNIEHSRQIKTWALVGVVAIAVVLLFHKTGKEKTSSPDVTTSSMRG